MQPRDRRSKMRLRRIPEFGDEGMAFERLLYDAALNAAAAPVNEADLAETLLPRGVHVLLDDGLDVARREGMEVEAGFKLQIPHRPYWDLGFGIWDLGFFSV